MGSARLAPLRPLIHSMLLVEICFLALDVVAPLGAISQSISPLARSWPWLLAPARLLFGAALVDGSEPPEQGWPALALFALILVMASCAAALALPLCRRMQAADRRHLVLALGGAVVLGMTLVLLPSLPSDDVFSYILYGRISVVHHANPLIVTPAAFPQDPFLTLVFWRGVRSVYGPVWLSLSCGLTALAGALGGSLTTYVLLFKLLGLAAHLTNAVLIWGILSRLAPRHRLLGTLLYAWNPLCLLEFCASAHNDAVMLTFALLGIYCLARSWEWAAPLAFGLSISTKYVLLALLLAYLLLIIWRGTARGETLRRAVVSAAWRLGLVLAVIIVTALPFWAGPQTFAAILYSPPTQQLDNSLLESLSWPLRAVAQAIGFPRATAASLIEIGLKLAALVVFLLLWLRELRRARDLPAMLMAWGWMLFWYVVIASGWFWPWYVTWVVALAALLPWGMLSEATLLLAGGALTLYAFLPLYAAPIYGVRAWLAFGPALLYLAWRGWQRWRSSAFARTHRSDLLDRITGLSSTLRVNVGKSAKKASNPLDGA